VSPNGRGPDKNGYHGDDDDSDKDDVDVVCGEFGDARNVGQPESQQHDPGRPENGPNNIEHRENASRHCADTGGYRGERSHDGYKSGDGDGGRAEPVEEALGARDAFSAKKARLAPVENAWARRAPNDVTDLVSKRGRQRNGRDYDPERLADHPTQRENPRKKEQGVTG